MRSIVHFVAHRGAGDRAGDAGNTGGASLYMEGIQAEDDDAYEPDAISAWVNSTETKHRECRVSIKGENIYI